MLFDVAIIGLGPAGACLANLLGQRGLSVVVLEREADIYPLPRAIHFDGEVMRIFQNAGLRAPVEAITRPGLKGMHFVNAQGDTLLIRAGTAAHGPHGCANNYYFHQPELEAVLRQGLSRFASVQVRLSCEVTDVQEWGDRVELSVTDRVQQTHGTVKARYVVGCDGARSLVRKALNAPMKDLGLHQPWLVFDAVLKPDAPELPSYTVQHCDPARPMTYCNVTGNRRRWEIMLMPGDVPEEMVKPENLWPLLARWIRPEHADIERAVIYTFHSIIAEGWRKGRLMLAGDSAHQTPPFLGQGMCAGLRDVFNLAWKLDAVIRGKASPDLLDTYESERSPHVEAFIALAVRLGDIIQTTDPQEAQERDRKFKAGQPEIFSFPSPRLGPGVLTGDHPLVGQPMPQPALDSGQLLDAVLDQNFAIIASPELLNQVSDSTRNAWLACGIQVLPARDKAVAEWLQAQQLQAVALRPDRYIQAVANTPGELAALSWPQA